MLGTFNFHLENNLKGQHWPIREDLGQELTNLIDGMKLILKDDNKDLSGWISLMSCKAVFLYFLTIIFNLSINVFKLSVALKP